MKRRILLGLMSAALLMFVAVPRVEAAAVRLNAGFNTNNLPANDDGSTGAVNVGFTFNLFGLTQNFAWLNNNGNITFTSPLGTFTPFPIVSNGLPMLAPFFADVDTRVGNLMTYGNSTVDGHNAFGVNWINVGYFSVQQRHLNTFQLVMIERADVGPGAFDFEFNYDQVTWETGQASGSDIEGCNGSPARVGYTNGIGTSLEFAGSGVHGALTNGNCGAGTATELISHHTANTNVDGRYLFSVRNGDVENPTITPEPGSLILLGTGMAIFGGRLLRRKSAK